MPLTASVVTDAGSSDGSGIWSKLLLVGCFGALVLALMPLVETVATIGFDFSKIYNEGWNAYHTAELAADQRLYTGDLHHHVDYPFLSFYLIAWLKPLFGNLLLIGRILNITSFFVIAVLIACIIRAFGGGVSEMVFGAACVIGFQTIQAFDWIGTDEPQMLAEALMLGGLLTYISGEVTTARLAACAAFFVAGGFVKHNVFVIPLAVSIDLLVRQRRWFGTWCLCSATVLGVFFVLCTAIGGADFWSEVFAPRFFQWSGGLYQSRKLLIAFKIPILASALYAFASLPSRQGVLLRSYGLLALVGGSVLGGGFGVSVNTYLDFAIWLGLVAGLALGRWRRAFDAGGGRFRAAALLPLVFAAPIVSRAVYLRLFDLPAIMENSRESEAAFAASKAILRQRDGIALCDDLLLCLEAGKPLIFDPFSVRSEILAGRLSEGAIISEIADHRFSTIVLPVPIHPDPADPAEISQYLLNQGRYDRRILEAIDRYYRLIGHVRSVVFLAPREL